MKRVFLIISVAILSLFAFVGCGKNSNPKCDVGEVTALTYYSTEHPDGTEYNSEPFVFINGIFGFTFNKPVYITSLSFVPMEKPDDFYYQKSSLNINDVIDDFGLFHFEGRDTVSNYQIYMIFPAGDTIFADFYYSFYPNRPDSTKTFQERLIIKGVVLDKNTVFNSTSDIPAEIIVDLPVTFGDKLI